MNRYVDPFDKARKLAGKTDPVVTGYYHSSVILDRKGRIISTGVNHFNGHQIIVPSEGEIDKTIHSEVHALTKVNIRRLNDAVMINYARTNVRTIMSRPCATCWAILTKLGFRKVIYSVRSASLESPIWKEESL